MSASRLPTRTISTEILSAPPPGPSPGPLVLERYRLIRRLGTGAFGTVWQAHDERLDREVAVKIIPRERVVGGRFEREARAAARLAHPGIVTLYEAGADDEGAYLVSELVRGATLAQLLAAGVLSDRDIVVIGIALCDALAHAHAQRVVHRDVKPSNVLVPEQRSTPAQVAKLTDFGVARVLGDDSLTRTGEVIGTAAYMSPEQSEGREAGAAADLYALALVLYEALTGVNPVRMGTVAVRARRLGAHLPALRRQRRDLPAELGLGVDRALRPRPRERGSIEELRACLSAGVDSVADHPGVVGATWRPRVGTGRYAPPFAEGPPPPTEERPADGPSLTRARVHAPARALAAISAAGLAGWLAAHLLHPSPLAPVAFGLLAGALIALVPRLGFATLAATLTGSLIVQGRPGGALVVGIAALVPVLALPWSGAAWPLGVAAPALGVLGLAGAWPAIAARAPSPWRRAALGLVGWVWLVLAEPIAGVRLYLGGPPGGTVPAAWMESLGRTADAVLHPLLSSGALAGAPVWAAGAAILPLLVRGGSVAIDLARVAVWATVLVSASAAAIGLAAGARPHPSLHGAIPGALLGAVLALSAVLAPRRLIAPTGSDPQARLP